MSAATLRNVLLSLSALLFAQAAAAPLVSLCLLVFCWKRSEKVGVAQTVGKDWLTRPSHKKWLALRQCVCERTEKNVRESAERG